jgi:hypothetical protein
MYYWATTSSLLYGDQTLVHHKDYTTPLNFLIRSQSSRVKLDIRIFWPLNISRTLCLAGIKLSTLVYPKDSMTLVIIRSKVEGKAGQTAHRNILTAQYLENPLLDRHQTWHTGSSFRFDEPYWLWGQDSNWTKDTLLNFFRNICPKDIKFGTLVHLDE